MWSYRLCQNLGQIDLNLHHHFLMMFLPMCKPPIFNLANLGFSRTRMSFKNFILQDFDQEQVPPQIYKLKVNPTGWG